MPSSGVEGLTHLRANWPILCAILFFLALIALIGPWSELPLNDDWQYAHFAKSFAESGTFRVDVPVAPSVVGQSVIAWPIIRIFGFSHLALRLLTLVLSGLILVELDYLLKLGVVGVGVRLVALCVVVANPIFLHLSTTFMTENYGYSVAFLAACVWFRGRSTGSALLGVVAAAIGGLSFWIRQFSALVFPALIVAEWIAGGASLRNLRAIVLRRAPAILVWVVIVVAYFPWAKATGNYAVQFSQPLSRILRPDPAAIILESGVYLFYLTVFFLPFLLGYLFSRLPSRAASIVLCVLVVTATVAWVGGVKTGPPSADLHSTFPFLHNVLTSYGVGPITLTDVYRDNVQTRPHISAFPWLALEACAIFASLGWARAAARTRDHRSEIGIFGVCFGLISLVVVLLSFGYDVLDRYHYPGLLGFTIALAAFFPMESERRLRRLAIVWVGAMATFSTLALHDYFRWQEARARLLFAAEQRGVDLSEIDAGYEMNGWNTVEAIGRSPDCGFEVKWFCRSRRYRIGLEQGRSDRLILSRATDAWLVWFPDLKLMERQ
jgi:hypothetical protein